MKFCTNSNPNQQMTVPAQWTPVISTTSLLSTVQTFASTEVAPPLFAWYESGKFDLANLEWANTIEKNGHHATLMGSGLTEFSESGNGASGSVRALKGTPVDTISFGSVIKTTFSICSVTRYTNSDGPYQGTRERILQGEGINWLHGHHQGNAGVAFYGEWMTAYATNIKPTTDWVVMCGTNAGSQLKLANGANVGTETGGNGNVKLWVNYGWAPEQKSHFAIAEVMVWDRGLTSSEIFEASYYLMDKFGIEPSPPLLPSVAWYESGTQDFSCSEIAATDSTVSHSACFYTAPSSPTLELDDSSTIGKCCIEQEGNAI